VHLTGPAENLCQTPVRPGIRRNAGAVLALLAFGIAHAAPASEPSSPEQALAKCLFKT